MLLRKILSINDCQLKMVGDSGQFAGYASVFNVKDLQGDVVLPGAYKATLAQHGLPKMFFNHEWRMPIGRYTDASEDSRGLYVKGELTPGHSLASDVLAAMRHLTLDGLSVGGGVRRGDFRSDGDTRYIDRWTILREVSPTVFPANEDARISHDSVKSAELLDAIEEIETVRDLERFLRDAGGISKGAATALVARAKVVLVGEGDPAANVIEAKSVSDLVQRLQALSGRIAA